MYPTVHYVFDTATNVVPTEKGKPQSKLADLALSLLCETIQQHTVHDPVEDALDALASLQIYLWISLGSLSVILNHWGHYQMDRQAKIISIVQFCHMIHLAHN